MPDLMEGKLSEIDVALRKFIDRNDLRGAERDARLLQLEQIAVSRGPGSPWGGMADDSVGAAIVKSDGFKALQGGARQTGKVTVGNFHTKAYPPMINAPGPLQPLVPDVRVPGIIRPGLRPLVIRDLLTALRTNSNLIQYTREDAFNNMAGPQQGEGIDKPQSNLTFSLHNAPVQTIGHWISASRQLIDDAPALEDYVNQRLMWGLKLVEENQFVNGDGTGQNLSGLLINSTAYTGSLSGSRIDILANAIEQCSLSGFLPDAVVLSLFDFWQIVTTKSSIGTYILGDVQSSPVPRVWGLPMVVSQVLANGTFIVGNFAQGASIWDRMDATIEISREHANFFTQNLIAILCEERTALTVFRSSAFVSGSFPSTGS